MARSPAQRELATALAKCVDLIEAWAYGPVFNHIKWPGGRCQAPALVKAKELLAKLQESK